MACEDARKCRIRDVTQARRRSVLPSWEMVCGTVAIIGSAFLLGRWHGSGAGTAGQALVAPVAPTLDPLVMRPHLLRDVHTLRGDRHPQWRQPPAVPSSAVLPGKSASGGPAADPSIDPSAPAGSEPSDPVPLGNVHPLAMATAIAGTLALALQWIPELQPRPRIVLDVVAMYSASSAAAAPSVPPPGGAPRWAWQAFYTVLLVGCAAAIGPTCWSFPLFPFRLDSLAWTSSWLLATVADYYGAALCLSGVILASVPEPHPCLPRYPNSTPASVGTRTPPLPP